MPVSAYQTWQEVDEWFHVNHCYSNSQSPLPSHRHSSAMALCVQPCGYGHERHVKVITVLPILVGYKIMNLFIIM